MPIGCRKTGFFDCNKLKSQMNISITKCYGRNGIVLRKIAILFLILMSVFSGVAAAGDVSPDKARIVAENWLYHVVYSFGSWGGTILPAISGEEPLVYNGMVVGYNFTVNPKGHILVSARDDIPAVKLYSESSTLSVHNESQQEQAAWIAEEIFQIGETIDSYNAATASSDPSQNPDLKAWARFKKNPGDFKNELMSGDADQEAVSYGPLLTTAWAQSDPYNQQCPLGSSGCRALVGCVATAASQIMKFWNYPGTGQGQTSYTWNDGKTNVTLSRNFADSSYDWANMTNALLDGSSTTQKSAVSKLSADVGVAFQMEYGCDVSLASTSDAPNVFIKYFRYQNTAVWVSRNNYTSQSAWMQVFKAEAQAGRPSQLSVKDAQAGGHSVVVDGYRNSPLETVHINMGWSGNYDGWYTPDSFITGNYTWSDTGRGAAIGIQPPTPTPTPTPTPIPTPTPTPTPTPAGCTATINGNLLFQIPYLSYIDPISGILSFWADFVYEFNPTYPTAMFFKLTNAGIITNPSYSCAASTLSEDLKIHIPDVLLTGGITHFWVDLEYGPAYSTNGNAFFFITNYGVVSN
jgi:hypothetical protein